MSNRPNVSKLLTTECPRSIRELEDIIRRSRCVSSECSFERLEEAIGLTGGFFEQTLPFLWQETLQGTESLPDIPFLRARGSVTLTQGQCLCILGNAFFCTFAGRISDDCVSGPDMPSINFDELYGGPGRGTVKVAKLRMLFHYFEQCRLRLRGGDLLSRPVRAIRRAAENATTAHWEQCDRALIPPVMHPLRQSLDEAKSMLRVDFANRIVGGAAIAYGCVQEEIMFCVCPELIVSRLFCPAMGPDEAIVFVGAEQFSTPVGYGSSLGYGGPYVDSTPIREDGALNSHVVAIDALDWRGGDRQSQYTPALILRELGKAWAGFDVPEAPRELATGNWGCGAFGGDPELKSVLQWMAASRAGKTMHYFPWDNEEIHSRLPELTMTLVDRHVTVGESAAFLFQRLRPGAVFAQMRRHFGG